MEYEEDDSHSRQIAKATKAVRRELKAASPQDFYNGEKSLRQHIADMGFDPLEQAVKIAKGESLKQDNPFLQDFLNYIQTLRGFADYLQGKDNQRLFGALLDKFEAEGAEALCGSMTNPEHRVKMTIELLQYLHPKQAAVKHSVENTHTIRVKPLTDSEMDSKTYAAIRQEVLDSLGIIEVEAENES